MKKTMPTESKTEGGGGKLKVFHWAYWWLGVGDEDGWDACEDGWYLGEAGRSVEDYGSLLRVYIGVCMMANIPESLVITDPMDSKFDLEAYLTMKMADQTK